MSFFSTAKEIARRVVATPVGRCCGMAVLSMASVLAFNGTARAEWVTRYYDGPPPDWAVTRYYDPWGRNCPVTATDPDGNVYCVRSERDRHHHHGRGDRDYRNYHDGPNRHDRAPRGRDDYYPAPDGGGWHR